MRRFFTRRQKMAAQLASGKLGEADHIIPHSQGGATDMSNVQILSPAANRAKGAFKFEPRKWQSEFIKQWEGRKPSDPFMLIAIPGSGKTMAALAVASRWVRAAVDRKLLIVVPTVNLAEQWRNEAMLFGLELQTASFSGCTQWRDDFDGAVVTYSYVASARATFATLCAKQSTMVVLDEVHHCGDQASFGTGVLEAFSGAREKLLMSGTPWKSDGSAIPFVTYDANGYAAGDYSYDLPRALSESVVRCLVFNHQKGSITNDVTGDVLHITETTSDADAEGALMRLLDASGDYVRGQIASAHERLVECRKTMPDAAALAVCMDQAHASEVAGIIRQVTGCKPTVIVSDSDKCNGTVSEFRRASSEWLVSVGMVSEGTDIKRLQVLCWLTNKRTELLFRQIIGRVSRRRYHKHSVHEDDFEAYVILPADPRLIQFAANIENAQVMALREEAEREISEIEREDREPVLIESYSTQHHGTEIVLFNNVRVAADVADRINALATRANVPVSQAYRIVMAARDMGFQIDGTAEEMRDEAVSKEDRMKSLRDSCAILARKYAYALCASDPPFARVNAQFARHDDATEEELIDKRRTLLARIKEANANARTQ